MIHELINLTSMSDRGKLVAEGIILRVRQKEIINLGICGRQPDITKQKLYEHLQKTIRKNNDQLSDDEREGLKSFFDYCNHYFDKDFERGECLHANCESFIYPAHFFQWLEWWCSEHPEDEDTFLAIFDKWGSYPRYHQPTDTSPSTKTLQIA